MYNQLPYILEVQICFSALWILYRILLHNDRAFARNRVYLLGSVVVSFVLPLLAIPIYAPIVATTSITVTDIYDFAPTVIETSKEANWWGVGMLFYIAGVAFMAIRAVISIAKINKMSKGEVAIMIGNTKIFYNDRVISAFSIFNKIFINNSDVSPSEIPQVVTHEMSHIRLYHTVDLVVSEIIRLLFWWNPFVWMWNRSLREVHEFQADDAVLCNGFDSEQYIALIIQQLTGIQPEFVSGFSYSLIKKRLIMISKNKTTKYAAFKIMLALPMICGLMMLFSFTERSAKSMTSKDAVTIINEAALRAESVNSTTQAQDTPKIKVRTRNNGFKDMPQPLYIVDGVEVSDISSINSSDIDNIEVSKDADASAKYGEKGKNGVVIVTTKKGAISGDSENSDETKRVRGTIKANGSNSNEKQEVVVVGYGAMKKSAQSNGNEDANVESQLITIQKNSSSDNTINVVGYRTRGEVSNVTVEGNSDAKNPIVIKQSSGSFAEGTKIFVDGKEVTLEALHNIAPINIQSMSVLKEPSVIKIITKSSVTTDDKPSIMVETMPKFEGGDISSFRNWVMTRLKYPEAAIKAGKEGYVLVNFVVGKSGEVYDVASAPDVNSGIDKSLIDEAIRVVKSSPKWEPGFDAGKPVAVRYTLPIKFSLN